MEKLILELMRLYLPAGALPPEALAAHLLGRETRAVPLVAADGTARAIAIPFSQVGSSNDDRHWSALCATANALQSVYGFPAPGVSIRATGGFCLWIAFEAPLPAAQAQRFLALLLAAHFPDMALAPDAVQRPVELPPCVDQDSGRWAAFINPGMGASFIDEPGLDMSPPPAAQAAFLEHLKPVSAAQFGQALQLLEEAQPAAGRANQPARAPMSQPTPAPASSPASGGLLLRDATLEDIVRHLHAQGIEPTFRHLLPRTS